MKRENQIYYKPERAKSEKFLVWIKKNFDLFWRSLKALLLGASLFMLLALIPCFSSEWAALFAFVVFLLGFKYPGSAFAISLLLLGISILYQAPPLGFFYLLFILPFLWHLKKKHGEMVLLFALWVILLSQLRLEVLAILLSSIIMASAGFSVGILGAFLLFMLAFTAGIGAWGSFYLGSVGLPGYLGFKPTLGSLDWRPFLIEIASANYSKFFSDYFSILVSRPAVYGQILSWGSVGYLAGHIYNFEGKRSKLKCILGSFFGAISFAILQMLWTKTVPVIEVSLAFLVSLVISSIFIDLIKVMPIKPPVYGRKIS